MNLSLAGIQASRPLVAPGESPVSQADIQRLQREVQSGLTEFLKVCEDEGDLKKALQALPPGAERDLLLNQAWNVRQELRSLKHALLARQLADHPTWQWQHKKTVNKARADQLAQAVLTTNRMQALVGALQAQAGARTGIAQKAPLQKAHLTSDAFLSQVQKLGKPTDQGLNSQQAALILEQVARAVATEPNRQKQQQHMGELYASVVDALDRRGVKVAHVSDEQLAQLRAQIESALADPQLSPEEKSTLQELLPLAKSSKDFATNSFKIVQAIRKAPLPTLAQFGQASGNLSKGWALTSVALKWMGPVGSALGAGFSLADMKHQISEGNATSAQLQLGAAAAGAGAAGFGLATVCLVSGPPGWIAGGLGLIALGLGIAAGVCETDPFETTCQQLGLTSPGAPPPGPEQQRWLEQKRQQELEFARRQSWGYYRPVH